MRKATIRRVTTETQIQLALTIEGRGQYEVSTGIRFLDHMLELFARHGAFDLKLKATGDLDVDQQLRIIG
jgi:imidazoleglycerol-phosphate dehydratase